MRMQINIKRHGCADVKSLKELQGYKVKKGEGTCRL
jgi:hypothetical protein